MNNTMFAIIAMDAPGSEALRAEHREGHLAHFRRHADNILVAGPLSGTATGSLVIYSAASEEEARAFISGDPFHDHGVWGSIDVLQFKAGLGRWTSDL